MNTFSTQTQKTQENQRFSSEDVQQILTIALTKDVSSAAQLGEMAEELTIDEATLRYAIDIWQGQKAKAQEKQRHLQRFYQQELLPYVIVNAFLVILNIFLSGRITWSIYPLLGWGVGLALGAVTGLSPSLCHSKRQTRQRLAKADS